MIGWTKAWLACISGVAPRVPYELKPQVEPELYDLPLYESKDRFISYWHQIDRILRAQPREVLEIGVGNGFVSSYLKDRHVRVTSLDLDPRLDPDVSGSLTALPFCDHAFDVVACHEVLEHLPYDYFAVALDEIARVARRYALVSLPDVTPYYWVDIKLPKLPRFQRMWSRPGQGAPHEFDGQHYWEIGKADYPLSRIQRDMTQTGLHVTENSRSIESSYHRYFTLKKRHVDLKRRAA